MEQFEIEFFETDSGDCPVTEFLDGTDIKMTNGFIKKTQKTPRHEIETAKKYRSIYLSRMKGE